MIKASKLFFRMLSLMFHLSLDIEESTKSDIHNQID
jgi:hypothetical protein